MWNLANRALPQLYLAITSVAAARFLGPDAFGRQSFIAFAEISLILVLTAGVPQAVMRYVADAVGRGDPPTVRGVAIWGWRLESGAAVMAALALAAVAVGGGEPRAAWLFAAVAAAAGIVSSTSISFLQGLQRWRGPALIILGTGAVGAAAQVTVLAAGGGITGMFAVEAARSIWSLILLTTSARRQANRVASASRFEPGLRREAIRYALLASLSGALTLIIWRRSELFFLERFSSDAQIGFYTIAFTAATMPVLIFQGITGTMIPAVATLFGAGQTARIRTGFSRALRMLLLVALPGTAAAFALGPALVLLLYGKDFHAVQPVLLILLALIPYAALVYLGTSLLGAVGRLKPMLMAGIVASVVDIGLCFLLIPRYDAVGAAIANVSAQLTVGVPVIVVTWRVLGTVRWGPSMVARVAFSSAAGGAAAWACVELLPGVAGVAVGAALGICAFSLLAAMLRILPADDAAWLDDVLGRMFGGSVGWLIRLWAEPEPRTRAA